MRVVAVDKRDAISVAKARVQLLQFAICFARAFDRNKIEGTRKTFRELQKLYARFGHGDRIALVEGYHQHQYSSENQQAALDFLDRFNQMPVREGLPSVKELDGEELRCTRTGRVLIDYADARSLMDMIREYYYEHKSR